MKFIMVNYLMNPDEDSYEENLIKKLINGDRIIEVDFCGEKCAITFDYTGINGDCLFVKETQEEIQQLLNS